MERYSAILQGGAPWGFRLQGGRDTGEPLTIAKVNPNSKATRANISVGDVVEIINGTSAYRLNNKDAINLVHGSDADLELVLYKRNGLLNGSTDNMSTTSTTTTTILKPDPSASTENETIELDGVTLQGFSPSNVSVVKTTTTKITKTTRSRSPSPSPMNQPSNVTKGTISFVGGDPSEPVHLRQSGDGMPAVYTGSVCFTPPPGSAALPPPPKYQDIYGGKNQPIRVVNGHKGTAPSPGSGGPGSHRSCIMIPQLNTGKDGNQPSSWKPMNYNPGVREQSRPDVFSPPPPVPPSPTESLDFAPVIPPKPRVTKTNITLSANQGQDEIEEPPPPRILEAGQMPPPVSHQPKPSYSTNNNDESWPAPLLQLRYNGRKHLLCITLHRSQPVGNPGNPHSQPRVSRESGNHGNPSQAPKPIRFSPRSSPPTVKPAIWSPPSQRRAMNNPLSSSSPVRFSPKRFSPRQSPSTVDPAIWSPPSQRRATSNQAPEQPTMPRGFSPVRFSPRESPTTVEPGVWTPPSRRKIMKVNPSETATSFSPARFYDSPRESPTTVPGVWTPPSQRKFAAGNPGHTNQPPERPMSYPTASTAVKPAVWSPSQPSQSSQDLARPSQDGGSIKDVPPVWSPTGSSTTNRPAGYKPVKLDLNRPPRPTVEGASDSGRSNDDSLRYDPSYQWEPPSSRPGQGSTGQPSSEVYRPANVSEQYRQPPPPTREQYKSTNAPQQYADRPATESRSQYPQPPDVPAEFDSRPRTASDPVREGGREERDPRRPEINQLANGHNVNLPRSVSPTVTLLQYQREQKRKAASLPRGMRLLSQPLEYEPYKPVPVDPRLITDWSSDEERYERNLDTLLENQVFGYSYLFNISNLGIQSDSDFSDSSEEDLRDQIRDQLRHPNKEVTLDTSELPEGALYQTQTVEGDVIHTDTYYPMQKVVTTKKQRKVVEAPTYEGIGPRDQSTGLPLGLRQHVKETNRHDWYKEMFKSIHKRDEEEDEDNKYMRMLKGQEENDEVFVSEKQQELQSSAPINNNKDDYKGGQPGGVIDKDKDGEVDARYDPQRYQAQPRSIEKYQPGASSLAAKDRTPDANMYNPPPEPITAAQFGKRTIEPLKREIRRQVHAAAPTPNRTVDDSQLPRPAKDVEHHSFITTNSSSAFQNNTHSPVGEITLPKTACLTTVPQCTLLDSSNNYVSSPSCTSKNEFCESELCLRKLHTVEFQYQSPNRNEICDLESLVNDQGKLDRKNISSGINFDSALRNVCQSNKAVEKNVIKPPRGVFRKPRLDLGGSPHPPPTKQSGLSQENDDAQTSQSAPGSSETGSETEDVSTREGAFAEFVSKVGSRDNSPDSWEEDHQQQDDSRVFYRGLRLSPRGSADGCSGFEEVVPKKEPRGATLPGEESEAKAQLKPLPRPLSLFEPYAVTYDQSSSSQMKNLKGVLHTLIKKSTPQLGTPLSEHMETPPTPDIDASPDLMMSPFPSFSSCEIEMATSPDMVDAMERRRARMRGKSWSMTSDDHIANLQLSSSNPELAAPHVIAELEPHVIAECDFDAFDLTPRDIVPLQDLENVRDNQSGSIDDSIINTNELVPSNLTSSQSTVENMLSARLNSTKLSARGEDDHEKCIKDDFNLSAPFSERPQARNYMPEEKRRAISTENLAHAIKSPAFSHDTYVDYTNEIILARNSSQRYKQLVEFYANINHHLNQREQKKLRHSKDKYMPSSQQLEKFYSLLQYFSELETRSKEGTISANWSIENDTNLQRRHRDLNELYNFYSTLEKGIARDDTVASKLERLRMQKFMNQAKELARRKYKLDDLHEYYETMSSRSTTPTPSVAYSRGSFNESRLQDFRDVDERSDASFGGSERLPPHNYRPGYITSPGRSPRDGMNSHHQGNLKEFLRMMVKSRQWDHQLEKAQPGICLRVPMCLLPSETVPLGLSNTFPRYKKNIGDGILPSDCHQDDSSQYEEMPTLPMDKAQRYQNFDDTPNLEEFKKFLDQPRYSSKHDDEPELVHIKIKTTAEPQSPRKYMRSQTSPEKSSDKLVHDVIIPIGRREVESTGQRSASPSKPVSPLGSPFRNRPIPKDIQSHFIRENDIPYYRKDFVGRPQSVQKVAAQFEESSAKLSNRPLSPPGWLPSNQALSPSEKMKRSMSVDVTPISNQQFNAPKSNMDTRAHIQELRKQFLFPEKDQDPSGPSSVTTQDGPPMSPISPHDTAPPKIQTRSMSTGGLDTGPSGENYAPLLGRLQRWDRADINDIKETEAEMEPEVLSPKSPRTRAPPIGQLGKHRSDSYLGAVETLFPKKDKCDENSNVERVNGHEKFNPYAKTFFTPLTAGDAIEEMSDVKTKSGLSPGPIVIQTSAEKEDWVPGYDSEEQRKMVHGDVDATGMRTQEDNDEHDDIKKLLPIIHVRQPSEPLQDLSYLDISNRKQNINDSNGDLEVKRSSKSLCARILPCYYFKTRQLSFILPVQKPPIGQSKPQAATLPRLPKPRSSDSSGLSAAERLGIKSPPPKRNTPSTPNEPHNDDRSNGDTDTIMTYRGMFYNNPSIEMVQFAYAKNQGQYLSQDDLWHRPPKPPRGVPRSKKRYRRTDSDPGPRDILKILTEYRAVPRKPTTPPPAPPSTKERERMLSGGDRLYNYRNPPSTVDKATAERLIEEERAKRKLIDRDNQHLRRHSDFNPVKSPIITNDRFKDLLGEPPKVAEKPVPKWKQEVKACALALYPFKAQTAKELSFAKGDTIYLRRDIDKNWYEGEHHGSVGIFPKAYVEVVTSIEEAREAMLSAPSTEGKARAKYKFKGETQLEMSFNKGDIIDLVRKIDNNWWDAKLGSRKGIVPSSYVDVIREPTAITSPASKSPPLHSPPVNSTPTHSRIGGGGSMSQDPYQYPSLMGSPSINASNQYPSMMGSPSINASNQYGSPSINASNKPRSTWDKDSYSISAVPDARITPTKQLPTQSAGPGSQSAPVHIVDPRGLMQQLQDKYRAVYPYLPMNDDELELEEGDIVLVMERCDDGWFVGTSTRTHMFGTFPGNYVEKM
ncbi:LOW QUALITY PROTEIN: uncharacterized protein [Amphiura filiformis]|uniref:LOW QUALITY PROTEIN: uncharacterized protein n=1 Tax=Amphiura filiformis TaxID=82378 RepID=UPI003B21D7E4